MASKVFWLQPDDPAKWLSPSSVVDKVKSAFADAEADKEYARSAGERFLKSYKLLIEGGLGNHTSTPLTDVERQWEDAVLLRVKIVPESYAPFEVMVYTEYRLEIVFPAKTPFQNKRRTAERIAEVLGYEIEHFNPDE